MMRLTLVAALAAVTSADLVRIPMQKRDLGFSQRLTKAEREFVQAVRYVALPATISLLLALFLRSPPLVFL
jgi:hypothetical protein